MKSKLWRPWLKLTPHYIELTEDEAGPEVEADEAMNMETNIRTKIINFEKEEKEYHSTSYKPKSAK